MGQAVAQLRLALRGDAGKPLAETCVVRVHQQLFAGLGVPQRQQAQVGQLQLQRVEHAHGHHLVALRQQGQRALPSRLADEVRHHKHRRAALDESRRRVEQFAQPRRARFGVGRPVLQAVQQVQHMLATTAGRDDRVDAAAIEQGADPVAMPRKQACQDGGEVARDMALALLARAEVHRRAQVQQEPGGHLAVLGEHAHVRRGGACGDVPVDVAHVVVVLVLAQVGQVQAAATQQGAVVTLEQPVQPADHRPLQLAQQPLGVAGRL